jgi:hypothetical protein
MLPLRILLLESTNFNKLIEIAKSVRERFENSIIRSYDGLFELDPEDKQELGGRCHLASRVLYKEARKSGLKVKMCTGWFENDFSAGGHCWIEFEGKIIDITATQFGIKDKIFITDVNDSRYDCHHKSVGRSEQEYGGDHLDVENDRFITQFDNYDITKKGKQIT